MSERERWPPTDEEIAAKLPDRPLYESYGEEFDPADLHEPIRSLLAAAVEKALAEQEARHKREVIEARINEAREYLFLCDSDSGWQRLATIEAELAALEGGKP